MSNRELAIQLLDNVPEYKMGYVVAYLQGMTAAEADDDLFCEQLCRDYEADPDREQFVTLEDAAKACGVDLDAV